MPAQAHGAQRRRSGVRVPLCPGAAVPAALPGPTFIAWLLVLPGELRIAVWKARSASPVRRRSRTQTGTCGTRSAAPGRPRPERRSRPLPGTARPPRPKGYCLSSASTSGLASGSAAAASSGSSTKRFSSYWSMSRRRKRDESVLRAIPAARPAPAGNGAGPAGTGTRAAAAPRPGPRAPPLTTEPGKNPNNDFNVQIPSLQQFAGLVGIPRKTEQTGDGEQPLARFIGIHGTLGKGRLGPAP